MLSIRGEECFVVIRVPANHVRRRTIVSVDLGDYSDDFAKSESGSRPYELVPHHRFHVRRPSVQWHPTHRRATGRSWQGPNGTDSRRAPDRQEGDCTRQMGSRRCLTDPDRPIEACEEAVYPLAYPRQKRTGTCQMRRVPPDPGVPISKLPSSFSARRLMLPSPFPPPRPCPFSMPRPSSRT